MHGLRALCHTVLAMPERVKTLVPRHSKYLHWVV